MRKLLAALIVALALASPANAVEAAAGSAAPAPAATRPLIDVNSASAAELVAVPGIGPATAQAIVDLRATRGGFARFEDLLEVKGIGSKKLAALADYLAVVPPAAGAGQGGVAKK